FLAMAVARAPAKVILCGEHAVVHGSTGVAAAIGIYTHARIERGDSPSFLLVLPDLNVTLEWSLDFIRQELGISALEEVDPMAVRQDLAGKLAALLEKRGTGGNCELPPEFSGGKLAGVVAVLFLYVSIVGLKPVVLTIDSEIPMSCGLGSSAALAVSVAASLLAFARPQRDGKLAGSNWIGVCEDDARLISSWAFEAEKIIHGNPSGIDNTVCTFGNVVKMKNDKREVLTNLASLQMLITNTKVPRDTKKLVSGVRQLKEKHPKVMSGIFDVIDSISEDFLGILQSQPATDQSQQEKLEELVVLNQGLLGTIGVSHASIEKICKITAKYGLKSKLTGGGGGGCVITLLPRGLSPKVLEQVSDDLNSSGFECLQAEVGVQGVQILQ
ncbi:mevalonate kinase, partial [Selaginella moellendorffii]|uniref:mevalonate kinase n=1 Tax=Selaginella moellendorffii TaxID=88036 RepID=UPI000D1C599F